MSITCLSVLVTVLVTSRQPHVYQSRALLEILAFNEDFLNLRDIYPTMASTGDPALYVQTQVELLQQESLIEQAARKFHLDNRPEFQPRPTLLNKLRQDIRIVPLRNSRIIQIVCDARDASLAAGLANTVARTFIERSIETRQRAARQTYDSLRLQLEELGPRLPQVDASAAQSGRDRAREPFLATIPANRRFYEAMLQKANDARMASGLRQSNIRLIGPALPAAHPYKPNLQLSLMIGALGGLVLAIGCVMVQEQNTPLMHSPGEAGTYLALPELGAIPNDDAGKSSVLNFFHSTNGKLRIERAVLEQQSSCLSESFRTTLASILSASHHGERSQSLVFTSSRPMEGKTTVVSNLGFALTEIGSQVLLIDGDMRHPQLHRIFDQSNNWGLSDVLREWNSIDELPLKVLVRKTSTPGLYMLPGGTPTDNVLGLLRSGQMSKLFVRFREEFDYVLVDAPPCLAFTDAGNMARCADGLVLVVRARYTDRKTAQAAVQRLEHEGIRPTGVILNRWEASYSEPHGHPCFTAPGSQASRESDRKDWRPTL